MKSSDPPTTPPEPQADADQTTEDEDAEAAEAATLSRTGHRPLGDVRRRLMAEIEEEMKEKQNPSADESTAAPRSRDAGDTRKVLAEILQQLRQLNRSPEKREFSATKILGGLFQVISWGLLGLGLNSYFQNQKDVTDALVWGVAAVFTQVASLAFFLMHHQD
ncbi:MAG: hypothetical protein BIFFINMI_01938 [Phycisphaerae bacterium]|nr:hypothetical protein [Phycisphaerae bacterium]